MPSKDKQTKKSEVSKDTKKTEAPKDVKKSEVSKDTKKQDKKVVSAKSEPVKETKKVDSKKPVSKKPSAAKATKGTQEKAKKRSFKAIYENVEGKVVMQGRYCGAKPKQAACKALTGICKLFAKADKDLEGEIHFAVKETTRKSRGKTYYYAGQRVVLDEPITLEITGGKEITYKYNSIVKKANADDCTHLQNYEEVEEEEEVPKQKKDSKKTESKPKKEVAKVEKKSTKEVKKTDKKPVVKKSDTKKKPAKK